ncbi:MAG: hypothetical protein H6851_21025 [Geminicoccaceae bacterium]|nr:hypothetical protein [Geminicoccaceae bacterium]
MRNDPFERWNLTRIINASGTMTSLGASRVPAEIRELVDHILDSFVDIDELQSRASAIIARLTGAQAGCVTACSAAAMTQSVAACLTESDLARIEKLPMCDGERRVILPMGHMVNYGAPVDQTIRLAGAHVVPIGTAAQCETWHLRQALEDGAAAAMYVVSHHTVRENELPLDLFIELCQQHTVPVIVDMAAEYDLRGPVALGASLVIHSGHKFLGGVTSGIVAGSADLVRAAYLQHRGIARTMKVGKEGIVGAMAALERFEQLDHDAHRDHENARIDHWTRTLADVPGLHLTHLADWTGNPVTRIRVRVDAQVARAYAWELRDRLAARTPRIIVRDDLIEHGEFHLDPCNLNDDEADMVAEAIRVEVEDFRRNGTGLQRSWSVVKRDRERQILKWNSPVA